MKLSEERETLERGQWKGIMHDGSKCSGPLQQPTVEVLPGLVRSPCFLVVTVSLPDSGFHNHAGLDYVSKDKTIES